MKRLLPIIFIIIFLLFGVIFSKTFLVAPDIISGAPPYDASTGDYISDDKEQELLNNWKRPDGPTKVALQVGHWKTDEVPGELYRLRGNTGASGGGKSEWEVNYAIAEETAQILKEKDIEVEILPATVPVKYFADVFVSIHADGSLDPDKSGFKAAAPRRDAAGKATKLLSYIEQTYFAATGLVKDPNVTRNMRGYYAFSWWRYEHAVHPMTAAVIFETGFLTSASDRRIIVSNPAISAKGLADGITEYLVSENLLES